MMFGIDRTFDAALFIGYHNAAGTDTNPLAHTMNDRIAKLFINGRLASEFTVNAYTAAMSGVAPTFLSGDSGICKEAEYLVPGIKTVAVSEGFGRATISLAPAKAISAIRDGVEEALSNDFSRVQLRLPETFEFVLEFNNASGAYRANFYPGIEHPKACTLRFVSNNYFEILRAIRYLTI